MSENGKYIFISQYIEMLTTVILDRYNTWRISKLLLDCKFIKESSINNITNTFYSLGAMPITQIIDLQNVGQLGGLGAKQLSFPGAMGKYLKGDM